MAACINAGAAPEGFSGFLAGAGSQTACAERGQRNSTRLHLSLLPSVALKSKPDCVEGAKAFVLRFCARGKLLLEFSS